MPSLSGLIPVSSLTPDRVGRSGQLDLAFAHRNSRTILIRRRYTLPLQVLEPVLVDDDPSLLLMLLNPTGGVLAGDHLKSEIYLGADTHVCLTTPSATKVYRSDGAPAIQDTTFRLEQNAILEYIPDHVIPHPGAIFHQSVDLEMAKGSCAILFDAFATGRRARGEHLEFTQLLNRTAVTIDQKPILLDRLRLEPAMRGLGGLGVMDGFGYLATFVIVAARNEPWKQFTDIINSKLKGIPSVMGGVSTLSQNGCIIRFLTPSAPVLTQTFHVLWSLCRKYLLNLPPLNLRKY